MTVVLTCDLCAGSVAKLDLNARSLSGALMRARRDHAATAHGWRS
jgi:hypothetical protein